MPAVVPAKLYEMSRAGDPKKAIIDAVGKSIDSIHVRNNLLLVGTYISPEILSQGKRADGSTFQLLKADTNKAEDLWMGCMGLVLKQGDLAFKDDDRLDVFWGEQERDLVGKWVLFRFSSAWETHLSGTSVRFVEDREIKAVIDNPDIIVSKRHITTVD